MLSVNQLYNRHTMADSRASTKQDVVNQQLSSGRRINSAKDDAAGLQISNRLQTQILVKEQTQRNINDGISYGQTADAALAEVTEHLQRFRTLAIQAANGNYSDEDRIAIDQEVQQGIQAIDFIANNTEIFGKKPLLTATIPDTPLSNVLPLNEVLEKGVQALRPSGYKSFGLIPPGSTNVRIQIDSFGANDDIGLFRANGQHLIGQDRSAVSSMIESQLFTSQNGYNGDETYDNSLLFSGGGYNYPAVNSSSFGGMTFTYSGNGNPGNNLEELRINTVTEPLLLTVIGNGSFNITATWDSIGSLATSAPAQNDGPVHITATDRAIGENGYVIYEDIEASATSLNLRSLSVQTADGAQGSIGVIDAALKKVGKFRADIGANLNALANVARNQNNQAINLSAAKQRVLDTDVAATMAQKVKEDILQQSQIAVTAQAKQAFTQSMSNILNLIS